MSSEAQGNTASFHVLSFVCCLFVCVS